MGLEKTKVRPQVLHPECGAYSLGTGKLLGLTNQDIYIYRLVGFFPFRDTGFPLKCP